MSIANRITSMENNIRNAYHGLESVVLDTSNIDKNIENISAILDDFYDTLPKVSGSGSNISLSPTKKGRITSQINGDTFQQTYTGKNLFNIDAVTEVTNGTLTDGVISIVSNQLNCVAKFPTITLPAGTYYISADIKKESGSKQVRNLNDSTQAYEEVENPTLTTSYQRYVFKYTYSSSKNLNSILIGFTNAAGVCNIKNIMVSTSSDATYEKFVGGTASPNPEFPQNIESVTGTQNITVCGKNLFKDTLRQGTYNNLNDNRRVSSLGTIYLYAGTTYTFSTDLDVSTYRYGLQLKSTPYLNGVGDRFYDSGWRASSTFSFTPTADGYFLITISSRSETQQTVITPSDMQNVKLQIEKGSTATTYEAYSGNDYIIHLGNIELNKIGDYKDYITGTPDNWSIVNQIGTKTYNGSNTENWFVQLKTYRIGDFDGKPFASFDADNPLLYMNYFKWGNGTATNYKYGACWYILNGTQLVVQKDENPNSTTLAEFKTWLGTHNLKAVYPLATPTTTPITDTTLINDLNNFYYAMSKNGETNISVDGDLPIILDVSALKGEE